MSFLAESYKDYVKGIVVKFINENGKMPSKKDMENMNASIKSLLDTYGGWNSSLKALGFDKDKIMENIDDEEIMAKLKELQNSKGAVPTLTEIKKANIQIKVLLNKYGNWNNIKNLLKGEITEEEALNEKNVRNVFSIEETKEELVTLIKKTGMMPTIKDARDKGIKVNKLIKEFKTWSNAKKELGLYEVQREVVVNEIKEVQRQTIKRPSLSKLKEKNVNIKVLLKEYGSWKEVCNVLNIDLYDLDILKDKIVEKAKALGKTPLECELRAEGINVKPLSQKYGSWYKAVNELGLYKYNDEKVMGQIQELVDALDKTPTQKQLRENHISLTGLFKRYNGWTGVREAMGLPKYSKFTNSELKEREQQLIALGAKLGKTPTLKDVKDSNIHVSPLIHRYGSWNNLLFKLGFKLNNKFTDEAIYSLADEVKTLAEKIGKTPTLKDLKNEDIPVNPLKRKYGSFGKCLLAIGLKPRVLSHKLFDKDKVMEELKSLSIELGKVPSMKVAKDHGIKVHGLMRDMGSWSKVKEAIAEMQDNTASMESSELRLA